MVIHQQWQKRKQIVEENKMISKYRREMEKQYGYKFKEPIKMNPYDPNRKKSFKADIVGASDVVISDSAQKLI
jgi:hypothetical protein